MNTDKIKNVSAHGSNTMLAAGAVNYTIQSYQGWNKIADYESDETTVTLLNEIGQIEADFNYPQFTKADFDYFRSTCH